MEDRGQALRAAEVGPRRLVAGLLAAGLFLCGTSARAAPLDQRIPDLFGGVLSTSITPRAFQDAQRPLVADRFRGLSAALAAARSQAPVPSASGAFRFEWNDDLDTYVRSLQSLGSGLAERAQTLGRHTGTASVAYSRVDFDTIEGDRLSAVRSLQPALSPGFLARLPDSDRLRAADNLLETRLNLAFGFDLFFFTGAFGLTDDIDVSLALSVNRARMSAVADATILDPHGDEGAFFTVNQQGAIVGGSGPICSTDFRCATDGFSDSAFGTGDLFLRSKWHIADTEYADLAVAGVLTLPTGNADDFLGFHDPTFTPWVIASKTFGRVSPHLNAAYAFRSSQDVSQAEWIAGADILACKWLTLAADFLGFHDDKRDGVNDDVLQSAVGFKLNPVSEVVLAGTFQFPLNRDGLRADVIYTGQIEYTW